MIDMSDEDMISRRLKLARRALSCLSRREREAPLDWFWDAYRLQSMQRNLRQAPECAEQIVELARAEALVWQALADRNGSAIILALAIGMADAFVFKGEHMTILSWDRELRRVMHEGEHGPGAHRAA
jgi:hypothetical protein